MLPRIAIPVSPSRRNPAFGLSLRLLGRSCPLGQVTLACHILQPSLTHLENAR